MSSSGYGRQRACACEHMVLFCALLRLQREAGVEQLEPALRCSPLPEWFSEQRAFEIVVITASRRP